MSMSVLIESWIIEIEDQKTQRPPESFVLFQEDVVGPTSPKL